MLKTAARAEACKRAQTSCLSAAKVGVSPESVPSLINAYIGDDIVMLISCGAKLYKGIPCELVSERNLDGYYLEDLPYWLLSTLNDRG